MKIKLETLYTPYTLDSYQTFTFENAEDSIIYDLSHYNHERGEYLKTPLDITYDDIAWKYNTNGYLKALADNLINLLNNNILDEVILSITPDGEPISPREYNLTTDKIFLDINVDVEKLKKYIKDNQADYDKNKLKDCDGFWWFGYEIQTMLNYYLMNKSAGEYSADDYYMDQVETVDAMEFITYKIIK